MISILSSGHLKQQHFLHDKKYYCFLSNNGAWIRQAPLLLKRHRYFLLPRKYCYFGCPDVKIYINMQDILLFLILRGQNMLYKNIVISDTRRSKYNLFLASTNNSNNSMNANAMTSKYMLLCKKYENTEKKHYDAKICWIVRISLSLVVCLA